MHTKGTISAYYIAEFTDMVIPVFNMITSFSIPPMRIGVLFIYLVWQERVRKKGLFVFTHKPSTSNSTFPLDTPFFFGEFFPRVYHTIKAYHTFRGLSSTERESIREKK